MIGHTPGECLAPAAADYLETQLSRGARSSKGFAAETRVDTACGPRTLRSRALLSQKCEGQAEYVLFVAEDATEELAAHAQIHHMAHHDALTGLPNRTLFNERLKQALVRGHDNEKLTAALCLDLDNFKNINDSSAMPSVTSCCAHSASACAASCASMTPWPAWAVTSSPWC